MSPQKVQNCWMTSSDATGRFGDLLAIVVQEARQQHKTANHHVSHLLIHGVLHLMGWDHETAAEALAMEKLMRSSASGYCGPVSRRSNRCLTTRLANH